MDLKNPASWAAALPGIPVSKNASVLGNLNYGAVGTALGISEFLLLQQAGAAQLRDYADEDSVYKKGWGVGFVYSQYDSLFEQHFGDAEGSQADIMKGISWYENGMIGGLA